MRTVTGAESRCVNSFCSAVPFRGSGTGMGVNVGGRGKSWYISHVFLHIHPHSTSPDGINYVPDLVSSQVLEFTMSNETGMVPKIGERQGQE